MHNIELCWLLTPFLKDFVLLLLRYFTGFIKNIYKETKTWLIDKLREHTVITKIKFISQTQIYFLLWQTKTLPVSSELDSGYLVGHQSSYRWCSFQSKSALHLDHLTPLELSRENETQQWFDITMNYNLAFNSFPPSVQLEGTVCLKVINIQCFFSMIVMLDKDRAPFGESQPVQISDNAS